MECNTLINYYALCLSILKEKSCDESLNYFDITCEKIKRNVVLPITDKELYEENNSGVSYYRLAKKYNVSERLVRTKIEKYREENKDGKSTKKSSRKVC